MEKVIKEFNYIFQFGQTETFYTFKAVKKNSLFPKYRIKSTAMRFDNGIPKIRSKSTQYFINKDEMLKEFQFQYELCKKSSFTKSIQIIK